MESISEIPQAAQSGIDLDALVLEHGSHRTRQEGLCVMEAVAWFAGRPHSDHPPCVSSVIGAFLRRWNDDLDDAGRQRLKRFIPLVVGTAASVKVENVRAWMAADWFVRVHTPAWLRLAGLEAQAVAVESLPPLASVTTARGAIPALKDARRASAAAWDAASAAASAAGAEALKPTTLSLQASAEELLGRMIACGREARS